MSILFTMALAKRDFEAGHLNVFRIERSPLGHGWQIHLGAGMSPLVDARKNEPRTFKTLDAAVAALEEIGFKVDSLL